MKLSVITINKNNVEGLEVTLRSVFDQTSTDFEFIVEDGASADRSVDLIKEFERMEHSFKFKWNSEPDSGMYEAMNRGLLKATGDYCLFLNSGDSLHDSGVIESFIRFDSNADVISGSELIVQSGEICKPPQPNELTYDFFVDRVLRHQSTFIRTGLLKHLGGYSEKYKIVSDWEFWIKALIKENATYDIYPNVVSCFTLGGISNQEAFRQRKIAEENDVLHSIIPRVYPNNEELRALREINREFDYLKYGKLGIIVRFLIWVKKQKRQIHGRLK